MLIDENVRILSFRCLSDKQVINLVSKHNRNSKIHLFSDFSSSAKNMEYSSFKVPWLVLLVNIVWPYS